MGKAGGKSGILLEMVRGCGELMDYILDMFHTVWMEQFVGCGRESVHQGHTGEAAEAC